MIARRTPIMGNGPGEKPLFADLEPLAIAHNEPAASTGFEAFDVPARDFPGNRSPSRWRFTCRPKRNLRAWRRGALPALVPLEDLRRGVGEDLAAQDDVGVGG